METVNGLAVTALTKEQFYAACRQVPLALTVTPALGGGIRSVQVEPAVFEAKRRPQGRRLGDDVGYLALPAVMSLEAGKPYAAWAHHLIQEIDQLRLYRYGGNAREAYHDSVCRPEASS